MLSRLTSVPNGEPCFEYTMKCSQMSASFPLIKALTREEYSKFKFDRRRSKQENHSKIFWKYYPRGPLYRTKCHRDLYTSTLLIGRSLARALSPGQTDSQEAASWTCEQTCVGWPNGKKLALTCVQIWSRPKWLQVIASQRKCTQGLAKRSRK